MSTATSYRQASDCMLMASMYMQLTLPKPLGIRFTRGGDGGAYVVRSDAKAGNTDPQVEV